MNKISKNKDENKTNYTYKGLAPLLLVTFLIVIVIFVGDYMLSKSMSISDALSKTFSEIRLLIIIVGCFFGAIFLVYIAIKFKKIIDQNKKN